MRASVHQRVSDESYEEEEVSAILGFFNHLIKQLDSNTSWSKKFFLLSYIRLTSNFLSFNPNRCSISWYFLLICFRDLLGKWLLMIPKSAPYDSISYVMSFVQRIIFVILRRSRDRRYSTENGRRVWCAGRGSYRLMRKVFRTACYEINNNRKLMAFFISRKWGLFNVNNILNYLDI